MKLKHKLVFLDFETTGINVFNSDPIQLGAVYVNENLKIVDTFSSFIRPHIKSRMKSSSIKTHGLKMPDLLDKPTDEAVLERYFQIFGTDYSFAGWNISFDVPYFRKMCHRSGKMREFNKIHYRHLDVQSIVRVATEINLLPRDIDSLDDCIIFFDIERSKVHNALEDAKVTFTLFKKLLAKFGETLEARHLLTAKS